MTTERKRVAGQGTVEFVVFALLVMVPMFLIVPLLGKYIDMAHSTESASRYVAFQGTVRNNASPSGWSSDADLALEVRRRFFSTTDAPIKTVDAAGDYANYRNPLWVDAAGTPLIASFDDIGVGATHESKNVTPDPLPNTALHTGPLGLSDDNFSTGRVQVSAANLTAFDWMEPWGSLDLRFDRSVAIIVEGWNSRGAGDTSGHIHASEGFISTVYPISTFKVINTVIGGVPHLVLEPHGKISDTLDVLTPVMPVGDLLPEIVPCDRLTGSGLPGYCP